MAISQINPVILSQRHHQDRDFKLLAAVTLERYRAYSRQQPQIRHTHAADRQARKADMTTADVMASKREQPGLRIEAAWIITMDGDMRVLQNHTLVVINDHIAACISWQEAELQFGELPVVNRRNGILMPGLINAHTHLAMNLLKGFADDKPLKQWLENHIWPTEATNVSPEFVHDGTQLALAESLMAGVTTVNDMYFFPDVTAAVCREVGMRATVGLLVFDFPTAWADSVDQYFSRGLALHDTLRDDPLINTAFAPHSPYTVSRKPLERIAMLSAELDLPVHIHVHETAQEIIQFEQTHGVRPLQHLDEIGLLNPNLLAVHLTQLTNPEIERLANTGVQAIHCPESNLKLASGICPLAELLSAGVNVAVGTDGAASNNDLDLLGELRTASFLSKVSSGDASTLPAKQALRMVTIDAAKALGIADKTGSLEVGKEADCIVLEPDLSMTPLYDVVAQLVYTNCSHCVTDVWVAGKALLRHRKLLTLDESSLRDSASQWQARLSQPSKL